jgi:hypothetical protein
MIVEQCRQMKRVRGWKPLPQQSLLPPAELYQSGSEGGRIAGQLGRFQVGLRLARRDSAGRNRPTTIGAGASTSSQNGEDSPGREDVHCQTDEDKEFDRRRAGA